MKEYLIRPVTRYVVTEFEEGRGSRVVEEYRDRRTAWTAADGMAKANGGSAAFQDGRPMDEEEVNAGHEANSKDLENRLFGDRPNSLIVDGSIAVIDLKDGSDRATVPSSDGPTTLEESLPNDPPRQTR